MAAKKLVRYCALCNTLVQRQHPVCRSHLPYYLIHKNEIWLKELCAMEDKQARISTMESLPVFEGVEHTGIQRKSIRMRDQMIISERYVQKMKPKDIAQKYAIHYNTVLQVLKKHNKEEIT